MSDRESFAAEAFVEPVTLSEMGVALILLENELANLNQAQRRWARRYQEAQAELQELARQKERIVVTIECIKDRI